MAPKMQVRQQECCYKKHPNSDNHIFPSIENADLAYSVQNNDFFLFMPSRLLSIYSLYDTSRTISPGSSCGRWLLQRI